MRARARTYAVCTWSLCRNRDRDRVEAIATDRVLPSKVSNERNWEKDGERKIFFLARKREKRRKVSERERARGRWTFVNKRADRETVPRDTTIERARQFDFHSPVEEFTLARQRPFHYAYISNRKLFFFVLESEGETRKDEREGGREREGERGRERKRTRLASPRSRVRYGTPYLANTR